VVQQQPCDYSTPLAPLSPSVRLAVFGGLQCLVRHCAGSGYFNTTGPHDCDVYGTIAAVLSHLAPSIHDMFGDSHWL
jgi:hypothetical protein